MAKVRKETTRQRPETTNREAKLKMLVGAGLGNAAVWAAMEAEHPQIIEDTKKRNEMAGKKIDYDKELRGKIGRAINSTRALAIKDDNRVMEIVEATGGNTAQPKKLDEIDMMNRHRFSWGMPSMDYIYGSTKFVHLEHHPKSKFEEQVRAFKQRDENGKLHDIKKKVQVWVSGPWQKGDPMITDKAGFMPTRNSNGELLTDLPMDRQVIEHGCPESFTSIWGGAPGVGKSRTAIAVAKAVNKVTREAVLYVNGEAPQELFRNWVGNDADPDLFHIVSASMLPVERVCNMAYKIRPRVIIVDSVQTLAEWDKGNRGAKSAMTILRNLQVDVAAGLPHIILISQLNKANELSGSRDLEHLADCVINVTKMPTMKNGFLFDCPRKNRGGETPRHVLFKHTETSIECVSESNVRGRPYALVQPISPIIDLPSPNQAGTDNDEEGDE